MFRRNLTLPKNKSFFLFGARGTGKSSLLKKFFSPTEALYIDLLDVHVSEDFLAYPERFKNVLDAAEGKYPWVILDEVQKVPKLLDYVHRYIAEKKFKFALTGSSARKLRRGASNLLAGRAYVFNLFPLTVEELGTSFEIDRALSFGTLPESVNASTDLDRKRYLESYTQTYLREEIISEQIIRNLPPFIRFLDAAAQNNSEPLNYTNIAKDVNSDAKTISNYYDILEDTLLGFRLHSYERSIRKQQKKSSKFYFFDTGVVRALIGQTDYVVTQKSFEYGMLFESFIVNEVYRLLKYSEKNFKLSFLRVNEKQEIDLIIERSQKPILLCEIKSSYKVHDQHVSNLTTLGKDIRNSKSLLISRDPKPQRIEGVDCLPWNQFLESLG